MKYLVMTALTIALISCGKEGSMGPAGDKGDSGAQGVAGIDGKTVLNGNSDPTKDQGKSGDFYINTNNYLLFGPKTASGWGSGKSILGAKGDKGDKGEQGTTGDKGEADYVILSGSTDPIARVGKIGDFYYNSTSKTLFYRTALGKTSAWSRVAKLSNTIQFTATRDILYDFPYLELMLDIPFDVFERSMVNAYVNLNKPINPDQPWWLPIPGSRTFNKDGSIDFGCFIRYERRFENKTLFVFLNQSSKGYPDAEFRIVVTEADVFKVTSKKVDFKNYSDVNRYFQLGN